MNNKAKESVDLLVFGAHPDDAEIGMGATIAKHALAGFKVAVCDMTRAELSSNGHPALRAQEAAKAAEVLGLMKRINLELPDRGLKYHEEAVRKAAETIRTYRPRFVFAPYWKDRHPDHVACSELIQEAVFNAKLRKWETDLPAWTVERVYFYFINDTVDPDVAVDVTEVYDRKLQALSAYQSQFEQLEPDAAVTPLNQGYVRRVEYRDHLLGGRLGVSYAEGFVTPLPQLIPFFTA